MRVGVLFSGGKDSNYALWKALNSHEVSCLITIFSENESSYMFQSLGTDFTWLQAKSLSIPQVSRKTKGEKESELEDLEEAIKDSIEQYGIEGIVTGAIESIYQASRVEKICHKLGLWCINPLWQKNGSEFLRELIDEGFSVMIVGVFSYPLDKSWVGQIINEETLSKLEEYSKNIGLHVAGEGGEYETLVLDSPAYNLFIDVVDASIQEESENSAFMRINNVEFEEK